MFFVNDSSRVPGPHVHVVTLNDRPNWSLERLRTSLYRSVRKESPGIEDMFPPLYARKTTRQFNNIHRPVTETRWLMHGLLSTESSESSANGRSVKTERVGLDEVVRDRFGDLAEPVQRCDGVSLIYVEGMLRSPVGWQWNRNVAAMILDVQVKHALRLSLKLEKYLRRCTKARISYCIPKTLLYTVSRAYRCWCIAKSNVAICLVLSKSLVSTCSQIGETRSKGGKPSIFETFFFFEPLCISDAKHCRLRSSSWG